MIFNIRSVISHRGVEGFTITVYKNERPIGHISIDEHGDNHFVATIHVDEPYRRQGIAYKLYTLAGEEACRRHKPLVSEGGKDSRSEEATHVWNKLVSQGDAVVLTEYNDLRDFMIPCNPPVKLIVERALWKHPTDDTTWTKFIHVTARAKKDVGKIEIITLCSKGREWDHYEIGNVWVLEDHRRQGIGTILYSTAAELACEEGKALVSFSGTRTEKADAVWKHLTKKGVARQLDPNYLNYEIPCRGKRTNPERLDATYWGDAGAGILFFSPNKDQVFLTLRSTEVNEPNTWGIPGGSIYGDPHEGAKREVREELGKCPRHAVFDRVMFVDDSESFVYTTFLAILPANKMDHIKLNWENTDAQWFSVRNLPENLHFGLEYVIEQRPKLFGG